VSKKGPAGDLEKLLTHRRLGHDANQLLVDIMERWGGTKQFADDLYNVYKDPDTSPYGRQNILEMIQKLVVNNTNHNITKVADPAGLDDEDLQGALDAMLKRGAEFLDDRSRENPLLVNPSTEEAPDSSWDWPDT
jgi:hypothetical protein